MAFNIFWKIKFKSLRAGTDYTVNIYKDATPPSGYPLVLKGGAHPFETQEDDNEDMFTPVRTQSGYLRIVDDGYAENSSVIPQTVAFSWKDMLPTTDTDRPVTLTHVENGQTVVDWQGFMQAQDFGSTLYGGTQERAYPVQCSLTVTQGADINYDQKGIQNFAYLLKQIVDSIPSVSRPQQFVIQGGSHAREWMMKRIDWQNFVSEDADGNLDARFTMYECLEDLCRFWGWTARTKGRTMYLMCADDTGEEMFLTLTYAQLTTLAGGTSAGSTIDTFNATTLSGDVFASTDNDDYVQRGYNRAQVTADINRGDDSVIDPLNDATVQQMNDLPFQLPGTQYDNKSVAYTQDLLSINQNFLVGSCREGYASFNIANISDGDTSENINVIRIKKTGGNNVTPFVSLETVYEHCYNDGFLRMFGETYRLTDRYEDPFGRMVIGRSFMYVRIGIGKDRNNAMWFNGRTWQDSVTYCRMSIGNLPNVNDNNLNEFFFLEDQTSLTDEEWLNILPVSGLQGRLFVDLLGTSNTRVSEINGERSFELRDFRIEYTRNPGVIREYFEGIDNVRTTDVSRPDKFGYKNNNNNSVRMELGVDCIYATENACKFGYGELINPDGSWVEQVSCGGGTARPEQHLANRIVDYWATSKRRLKVELRSDVVDDYTPQWLITIDGSEMYPIAISREWRDDVTILTLLEMSA